eukprot:TRINITY_DN19974_c0_g1_i1.p1 TRINITY_DN19974_c0_g1~~TRINITY_DN19974_c0_g1_i1.p1  ORF type:complete len:115 (-),score=14.79 TRINITY_DN19974_c0_g1_i1:273-617(-)
MDSHFSLLASVTYRYVESKREMKREEEDTHSDVIWPYPKPREEDAQGARNSRKRRRAKHKDLVALETFAIHVTIGLLSLECEVLWTVGFLAVKKSHKGLVVPSSTGGILAIHDP